MPNILTISRIILIPVIMFSFFMQSKIGNILVVSMFVFCCITDFLDGYFARIYKQTTKFGQVLDPIADKALIATTLLFIIGFHKVSIISIIPASIILCREVMISEIRDIVFTQNKPFTTSSIAKYKTFVQMLSLIFILVAPLIHHNNQIFLTTGEILLWISAGMALISGASYYIRHWESIS